MRSEILDEFNDKVIKKAIQMVDTDMMARVLAEKIEVEMTESFDRMLENDFDFECWLNSELTDDTTVAGKAFKKAMNSIAKRMADAI